MRHVPARVMLAATLAAGPSLGARSTLSQANVTGDLVEVDVLVVDRDGRPVTDLPHTDFTVKEGGKKVDIKASAAVSGNASGNTTDSHGAAPRQLVLLLDDSSVPLGGTSVVQAMAQAILLRMRPDDDVTVIRLNNDRDEPF